MGQWQAQVEVRAGAELNGGLIYRVVQHVSAGGALGVDKMHVASGHRNTLLKHRGAEAADDAFNVVKAQLLIAAYCLRHRRIRLALLDHRAGNHVAEASGDTHRVHVVGGRLDLIDEGR